MVSLTTIYLVEVCIRGHVQCTELSVLQPGSEHRTLGTTGAAEFVPFLLAIPCFAEEERKAQEGVCPASHCGVSGTSRFSYSSYIISHDMPSPRF